MSTTAPIFTAGGLASGLDTNTIVDKLVALEQAPITKNTAYQAALTVQISAIGDLTSKIKALATAATSLGKGVSANNVTTVPAGIGAVAGVGAMPGNYSITVSSVASSARARSTAFTSANDTVAGGDLKLHIQGVATTITIAANSDLGSVVKQINQSGNPINAAVVSDGTHLYVSLTNRNTGKPIGSGDTGGLTIDSDPTGLGLTVTKNATNAVVKVDDLTVESQTNDISTAHRTASRVEAGFIWINEIGKHFLGVPFGGVKQSGIGREECFEEMLAFTQEKNIHVRLRAGK